MEEIYWGLFITFIGAIISIFKDWKNKSELKYLKSNVLGICGFILIISGGVKSCLFAKGTLAEKKLSDSIANSRQDTIIQQGKNIVDLNKQLSYSLKSQLDTTITILSYSKELSETQQRLAKLQNENNQLQSELYTQVTGGEKIDKSFTITIVIDKNDYLPVTIQYGNDHWKTNNLARYAFLARPVEEINGKRVLIGKPCADYNESINFLQQSLQYKIVSDLADIQNVKWTLKAERNSTENISKSDFALAQTYKLSNPDKIEGKTVLDIFSNRPFMNDMNEISRWSYGTGLPVPRGTKLSLDSTVSQKYTAGEYRIVLTNTQYFRIEFIIEPLGSSQSLPKEATGINTQPFIKRDIAERCMTCYFKIRMNALFYSVHTGNPQAIEYKKWADWLFVELEKLNYSTG